MQNAANRRKTYRRSEDIYAKSIEEVKDYAIFMTDSVGRVVNWNLGATRILGYEESEILGHSAAIFFTPEDRLAHQFESEMSKALVDGRAEDERWHIRRDNSRFWASGILTPAHDDNGVLIGFTKVMRDMTDRKRLEDERDRFFSLSMDMLCIVRLDGYFDRVNPVFEKALGHSEQELLSQSVFDYLHNDDRPSAEKEYEKLRTGQPTKHLENRFRCKDGSYKWVAWSYFPVPEQGLAYGVGRDTTDLRLMNEALLKRAEELEQANRVKNEFLAMLSHELRTPLTSILGWTRLLRSGRLSDVDRQRAIQIVERNAQAQSKLIEDLLDVSRIITEKLRIEFQPVALSLIVDNVINELRPSAETKSVRLESTIDPAAGPIMGDPTRLEQIVTNLLSNAIKFTNAGGNITVTLERIDSQARLRIRDTGIGISPSVLPHIFERFRQADSSDVRPHTGLGLGLAIVQHLVLQQKGTVFAESEGVGHGSTFTVEFPLLTFEIVPDGSDAADLFSEEARLALKDAEILAGDPGVLRDIHVLLVEDESDTRELIKILLEESGARVTAVNSSSEAMKAFRAEIPDVLISDIAMPADNGYELIAKVRAMPSEAGGGVPAVALTAYAAVGDRQRALEAGFDGHLPKPVDPHDLLAIIRTLSRRKNAAEFSAGET